MKKGIAILLTFLYSLFSYGQGISVSRFQLLETDLTANTNGTKEKDQNGETAALVKIVTSETGFTFDGGQLGIVKTLQTPGEIWLYIPRRSQKITIKHPQLGVLRDYVYPISIDGARTYEMVLVTGSVQTVIKKARSTQYVVFKLSPSNAVVEINGELLQTNDGTASKMLKFGTYTYKAQAPNYFPNEGKVTLNNPNETRIINLNLKPNFTEVMVSVDNNAEIWINGELKGNGIWSGSLGAGTYEFEARKKSHRSTSITQDIILSREMQTVKLESPTPIYGEVDINSTPALAEIFIDGEKIGETPKLLPQVLIGEHSVRISKLGYIDKSFNIVIKENETESLIADLEKSEVILNSSPDDSHIKARAFKSRGLQKTNIKTHDGGEYYGELKKKIPNGYGMALYKDGNVYEGNYVNGKRQGYGTFTFNDGERYEGEWHQDQQHGQGTFYFVNNNKYVGLWDHDYQQGHGIMYYSNGDIYDGNWEKDFITGKGTYTYKNGDQYIGQYNKNIKEGKGIFKFAKGGFYEGEWKNDKPNGKGVFNFANGDKYTGDIVDGKRHGYGTLKMSNGASYEGNWSNDKLNGTITYIDKDGKSSVVQFKDGAPL